MDRGCRSRVPTLCLIYLLVLVFSGRSCYGENRRPKNVQVSLRSNWHGTSLLLEAGELLSKEWKDLFWEFTELWIQPEKASNCSTARCCVEKIVADGRSLLSSHLGSIFEFSLTLRSASPRLALYRQLAEDSLSSFPIDDEANSLTAWSLTDGLKADHSYISTNPLKSASSCCWIDTGSTLLFNVPELLLWLDESTTLAADSQEKHELFDFDHVYWGSSTSNRVAILYGAVGTKCFQEFHVILAEASLKGKIKYVGRPVLPPWCQSAASFCAGIGALDAVNLGGYGVELALKNMEYKAMDDSTIKKGVTLEDPRTEDLSQEVRGFIFSRILERKPELTSEIMAFRDYLLSSAISDTLEVWELKDLGHQTAQRIVHSSDPLQSMVEINQNFPSIVSSLSRMKLNESIKEEIIANQRMVPPGKSLMALNGALINIEEVDLYQLTDMVHEELSMADQFSKIKVPQKTIQKLLSIQPPSESNLFRIDFRSTHVHYLNNLEEDAMYRRWRSNINEILMPVFPGQFRYIRKNLFHAVYVFDPATTCGAETVDMILAMYQNSVPMRFGVILYSSRFVKHIENQVILLRDAEDDFKNGDDVSSLIIKLFLYIKESYDSQLAFKFLTNVNKMKDAADLNAEDTVEVHMVEEAFVETVLSKAKSPPHETLLELEKESKFKEKVEGSSHFVYKLGLYKLQCCLLLNGLVHESSEDSSINAMNEELPRIQEQVYYGQITSNTDVLDKFLSESGYRRYNPQVIGKREYKNKFVTLFNSYLAEESILRNISYFHSPGTIDDLKPVSHILAANVMSLKGIELLREGLHYLIDGSDKARVGVVIYTDGVVSSPALLLADIFDRTASTYSEKPKVLHFLDQVCYFYGSQFMDAHLSDAVRLHSFVEKVCELALENDLPSHDVRSALLSFSADLKLQQMDKVLNFLQGQLGIDFGSNAVITNGRVLVSNDAKSFSSADFELLESVEYQLRTKHIYDIIAEVEWLNVDPDELTSKFYSDVIMLISSAISNHERSSDRAHFEILNAQHSAIILNSGNSNIHIDAVIDPLSASGQKLSPFLLVLWKRIQPSMRIILNPVSSLVDLPLKNYYRFVIPSMDDYSPLDNSVGGPKAYFANMPLTKTLTMNLDVPEPWLVEPIIAIHDLDNILLENLGDTRTLQAVFELEALLLTGHCSEKDHDPPRGLQLILGTKQLAHLVDTLVMANLGYWQMKVSPGAWYLQLAPGRSAELYEMMENREEKHTSLLKRILINDLRGKLVHLEVRKKLGKELEELLGGFEDSHLKDKKEDHTGWNANLLKWASGFISGSGISKKRNGTSMGNMKITRRGETVNIFSVASGHLYERFLKIMILSVLKNTQRPLKFWFIKNYLSPQFKVIIPRMAQEYGFEYELITYKWPTWLHKQKEKQRIIWAYKILFLDVIFPLSLKKVIFVDADQVVRTDMGVLYDMDLKGRPLAYTPFCDNNKDMDGYRFWRQGFWKDHLRGKPYHISALYVVDLVKFRQMAAGDTLRVYYETLSKDPNSLSNLDQDLPNYAQHTVPIFSLPQEWLWCESWCGNSTKSKAKTIDLCNNPMTKEPKLQGAKRIIPEWVELDAEARRLTARVLGEEEPEAVPPNPSDKTDDLESMAEL